MYQSWSTIEIIPPQSESQCGSVGIAHGCMYNAHVPSSLTTIVISSSSWRIFVTVLPIGGVWWWLHEVIFQLRFVFAIESGECVAICRDGYSVDRNCRSCWFSHFLPRIMFCIWRDPHNDSSQSIDSGMGSQSMGSGNNIDVSSSQSMGSWTSIGTRLRRSMLSSKK